MTSLLPALVVVPALVATALLASSASAQTLPAPVRKAIGEALGAAD